MPNLYRLQRNKRRYAQGILVLSSHINTIIQKKQIEFNLPAQFINTTKISRFRHPLRNNCKITDKLFQLDQSYLH